MTDYKFDVEFLQEDVPMHVLSHIDQELDCAVSCERHVDFIAHITEAIASLDTLKSELSDLLALAKRENKP